MGRRSGEKRPSLRALKEAGAFAKSEANAVAVVRNELRARGLSLRKTEHGEWRVAFAGRGNEESAYYATDLADAFATGLAMAREGNRRGS